MNVLVDLGHPGHFHLTKVLIHNLLSDGHKVVITTKNVPIITRLLDREGFPYIVIGNKGNGLVGKIIKQIGFDFKLARILKKEKIDVATGTSMSIPRICKFFGVPSINMDDDDDEVQMISVRFSHPFSSIRLTPSALINHRRSSKAIFYEGSHELAYLHPKRFTPDSTVLERAGIKMGERFFIMRFVAFQAYHDGRQGGITYEQKKLLVKLLEPYGRVIITSEKPIEEEFEKYRLPVPPEDIHSLMSYSSMFIGDSQTMTSEAAILGVPALKCNSFAGRLSFPNMLEEKYQLCYAYQSSDFDKFYAHIKELLQTEGLKELWTQRRQKFLNDTIDVSAFFTWFIENYPESKRMMKENPDYQYKFK